MTLLGRCHCRVRQRPMTTTDTSAYGSVSKTMVRAGIKALYDADGRPMLYLDAEDAGATEFFLNTNVPKEHLVPVNYDQTACEQIMKKTGVVPQCIDIDDYLIQTDVETHYGFSVIWLDYTKRELNEKALRNAIRLSSNVSVTLSTRAKHAESVMQDATKIVRKCGGVLYEQPVAYKGAGDVKNMVRFSIKPKSKPRIKNIEVPPAPSKKKMKATMPTVSAKELVGRTIYMPCCDFDSDWEQCDIKKQYGCYVLQIEKTHYSKLAVCCVRDDGSLHDHLEKWTLTVDDVLKYEKLPEFPSEKQETEEQVQIFKRPPGRAPKGKSGISKEWNKHTGEWESSAVATEETIAMVPLRAEESSDERADVTTTLPTATQSGLRLATHKRPASWDADDGHANKTVRLDDDEAENGDVRRAKTLLAQCNAELKAARNAKFAEILMDLIKTADSEDAVCLARLEARRMAMDLYPEDIHTTQLRVALTNLQSARVALHDMILTM